MPFSVRLATGLAAMLMLAAWCPSASSQSDANSRAARAFETVRSVLQHPRCQNCHIPGDAPLQFDAGLRHTQNVVRGAKGHGATAMECATCHQTQNSPESYGVNAPPGAPTWHLPPPETKMVFIDLSPRELCAVIKDRKATGGKDLI